MKSTGNYFYVKKVELRSDFTQIPNALFYIDLSATEKLILAYLLSNAETFRVTNYRIAKSVGSDQRTVKKALKKFSEMKLISPATNRTITININEVIKLSEVNGIEEDDTSNLPSSTTTANSTITNSNSTANIVGELPSNNSNSTSKLPVEVPNNNTNQQEIQEEKQKQDSSSSSSSAYNIQDEVSDYLKTPSKFFLGNNQINCSRFYEKYREKDTKMTSIHWFEVVFYYHMLKMTNTKDIQELNQRLLKGGLSISLNDIYKTVQRIITEKEVKEDCQLEIDAVFDGSKNTQNNNREDIPTG